MYCLYNVHDNIVCFFKDDVAKQERLKAQARQVIKDARAKNARSQNLASNTEKGNFTMLDFTILIASLKEK